jgi:hypothetical protein
MQDADQKRIIEVNGVKLEVDMRYARKIEELRVGSKVKVLTKNYSGYSVYPGVIIGFEQFDKLPTIVVAYLESNWSTADVKFIYFNEKTEDVEICAAVADEVELNKGDAVKTFDREIQKKESELADLHEKKAYFQKQFAGYFKVAMEPAEISN